MTMMANAEAAELTKGSRSGEVIWRSAHNQVSLLHKCCKEGFEHEKDRVDSEWHARCKAS